MLNCSTFKHTLFHNFALIDIKQQNVNTQQKTQKFIEKQIFTKIKKKL